MSDLVERLRHWMPIDLEDARWMRNAAADRIEQLEAALDRAVTRGLEQVERIAALEAALRENQNYILEHCDPYHAASLIRRNRAALAPEQNR